MQPDVFNKTVSPYIKMLIYFRLVGFDVQSLIFRMDAALGETLKCGLVERTTMVFVFCCGGMF
jgi:hypothetical protein